MPGTLTAELKLFLYFILEFHQMFKERHLLVALWCICYVARDSIAKGVDEYTNLALHQPTGQSSKFALGGGEAFLAVDGNTDGIFSTGTTGSVTHTSVSGSDSNPWWRVTLSSHSYISSIVIHNRVDCCSERLHGANIFVDNLHVGSLVVVSGVAKYSFSVEMSGQVVMVNKTSQKLSLAEVVVIHHCKWGK